MTANPLRRLVSALAVLAIASAAHGQATRPAADDLDPILDRLHDVGATLHSLRANVTMATDNAGTGANSSRAGSILIERRGEGDTRARVRFDTATNGDRTTQERIEYLLDGDSVVERVYRKAGQPDTVHHRETKRQIRQPGDKTDLLKLGAGPFPLPIGQPKEKVREQFDVKRAAPMKERAGLDGVELTPRKGTQLASKFHSIVVWVKPGESMPSVIETTSPDESELKTTTLQDVKRNAPVADADFKLEPIAKPDEWDVVEDKLSASK